MSQEIVIKKVKIDKEIGIENANLDTEIKTENKPHIVVFWHNEDFDFGGLVKSKDDVTVEELNLLKKIHSDKYGNVVTLFYELFEGDKHDIEKISKEKCFQWCSEKWPHITKEYCQKLIEIGGWKTKSRLEMIEEGIFENLTMYSSIYTYY